MRDSDPNPSESSASMIHVRSPVVVCRVNIPWVCSCNTITKSYYGPGTGHNARCRCLRQSLAVAIIERRDSAGIPVSKKKHEHSSSLAGAAIHSPDHDLTSISDIVEEAQLVNQTVCCSKLHALMTSLLEGL